MNIIVPLGGIGKRFQEEGYLKPKPLINILGKQMIFWVLDNLKLNPNDELFIIYNNDLNNWDFYEVIKNKYPQIKLISLKKQTMGAAETILECLNTFTDEQLDKNCVTIDGDTFYEIDILDKYRKHMNGIIVSKEPNIKTNGNAIVCFNDDQDKPIYSYTQINIFNQVTNIKEKEKISSYANTGCYCFKSGNLLKKYCQIIINNNITQNSEYYISGVICEMLKDNNTFYAIHINIDDFHCVGTPLQVRVFCSNYENEDKKRFCFDLDNTLVTFPRITGDYTSVEPIKKNIELCRYLKKKGHHIIIYTARRMRTHNGNIGAIMAELGKITLDTLKEFNIPYDEIYFGKPYAHHYIDDLAVNTVFNLERELGFYETKVDERDFNSIVTGSITTVTKKSTKGSLDGEIYWYKNIPDSIKNMFPKLFDYDSNNNYYVMEKINGISCSHLLVNSNLSLSLFDKILEYIKKIHNSVSVNDVNINIYKNYSDKIKERYEKYDYSKFKGSSDIYEQLMDYFSKYENENLGKMSVIHGDPVFSNIINDLYGNIKFLDMRGKIGNTLTIYGDMWYDYGKIYQSILGYDEILLDKRTYNEYKNGILQHFILYIKNNFGTDALEKIKMITKSLLFTLIPLHDNDKCESYYNLISNI